MYVKKGLACFLLLLLLFLSNILNLDIAAASLRPTWGGALYAYESTLEQQVDYVIEVLPNILKGWGLELINESIIIDSKQNQQSFSLQNNYPAHTLRRLYFIVKNPEGKKYLGSLYLVEQLDTYQNRGRTDRNGKNENGERNNNGEGNNNLQERKYENLGVNSIKEVLKFNHSLRLRHELRKGNKIFLALSESPEPENFIFEISLSGLNLRNPETSHLKLTSSFNKIRYVKSQLENYFKAHHYFLVPQSVNVDFYTDYGFIYNFKDRYGQMLTLLVEDSLGRRKNVLLTLWENHLGHKTKLEKSECNSTLQGSIAALGEGLPVQLVLAKGYSSEDLRNELDMSIILQQGLVH
ncbi:MAG: hypothetical protein H6625_00010 [Bdellovibrionaceae bacterium]|nr:hypothetical protein [Pseudobdellovibrionaceae bacterium]